MTNQQGAPEALRLADWLQNAVATYPQVSEDEPGGYCQEVDQVMDEAAAELRRLHAENERLAALVDAQQPAPSAAAATVGHGRTDAEIVAQTVELTKYLLSWKWGLETEGDVSRIWESGNTKALVCWNAACHIQDLLTQTDVWNAVAELDGASSTAPKADSQPAPVLTSATGGDWTQPTTVALRLGDSMQLLCGGKRPPDDMVQQWLDNTSEELQSFAASHGPAWAQGIGLIDAAMVMVDQPTEIRTIDNPDLGHEHRAARAPADSVKATQQEAQEPVAYAIFAENGNIRLWATEPQHVKRIAAEQGLSLVKLYTAPQPAPAPLSRDQIREVFMAHGFTVKEGQTDLKQYVYDAAEELLRAAKAHHSKGV